MRIFYVLALFRIYPLNVCPLCWLSFVTRKEKNLTYIFNRLNQSNTQYTLTRPFSRKQCMFIFCLISLKLT